MSTHFDTNLPPIPESVLLTPKERAILKVLRNEKFRREGLRQQDIRQRLLFMPWKRFEPVFGRKVPSLGCIHRALKNLCAYGFAFEKSPGNWSALRG